MLKGIISTVLITASTDGAEILVYNQTLLNRVYSYKFVSGSCHGS
jgi:hypothetical protein